MSDTQSPIDEQAVEGSLAAAATKEILNSPENGVWSANDIEAIIQRVVATPLEADALNAAVCEAQVWKSFLRNATGLKPEGDDSADDWAMLCLYRR